MNTTTAVIEVTAYVTAKGAGRYRGECPACGAKFAGKTYPAQVQRAYAAHECEAGK